MHCTNRHRNCRWQSDINSRQSLSFSLFVPFLSIFSLLYHVLCTTHIRLLLMLTFFVVVADVVTLLYPLYVMPLFFSSIVIYWLWRWFLFFFLSFVHHFCLRINVLCRKRECWSANWVNETQKKPHKRAKFLLSNISRE